MNGPRVANPSRYQAFARRSLAATACLPVALIGMQLAIGGASAIGGGLGALLAAFCLSAALRSLFKALRLIDVTYFQLQSNLVLLAACGLSVVAVFLILLLAPVVPMVGWLALCAFWCAAIGEIAYLNLVQLGSPCLAATVTVLQVAFPLWIALVALLKERRTTRSDSATHQPP